MTDAMRLSLARLPYEEKLRRVAELIEFSRRFKAAPATLAPSGLDSADASPAEAPSADLRPR